MQRRRIKDKPINGIPGPGDFKLHLTDTEATPKEKAMAEKIWNRNRAGFIKMLQDHKVWPRINQVVIPGPTWITAARRHLGLSFHEFGGVVGAQAEDVKSWEKGKTKPSPSASRLMGLMVQKPHLVRFMMRPWKTVQLLAKPSKTAASRR